MTLITWRDEFALGIPGVDHEHRELIALINQIHAEAVATGDTPALVTFLGELHARVAAHFALEEREMRERGYAGYAAHKDDHERLLEDVLGMIEDCEVGLVVDLDAFSTRLDAWFTTHFREHDAQLHRAFG